MANSNSKKCEILRENFVFFKANISYSVAWRARESALNAINNMSVKSFQKLKNLSDKMKSVGHYAVCEIVNCRFFRYVKN